jgi:glycosyltransferase involved in cell wall biosynthesis
VDAGSTDATRTVVENFVAPFRLTLLARGELRPGEARNEGVAHTTMPWVVFVDGGFELDPNWLEALLQERAASSAEVVFGSYDPLCDTPFRECAAIAYVPERTASGGRGPVVPGMLIRRSTFTSLGGFRRFRAAEDLFFLDAIHKSGISTTLAPCATAVWQIPGSWPSLFRRFAEYSWHNLAAGRWRLWHLGVARLYSVLLAALTAAYLMGLGAWSAVMLPAFFIARASKSAWVKRSSFSFPTLRPTRIAGTAIVLAVIDAATLLGAVRWLAGAESPFPRS